MTTWDEIESANRRARNVRLLKIAILVAIGCYAWSPVRNYIQHILAKRNDPDMQLITERTQQREPEANVNDGVDQVEDESDRTFPKGEVQPPGDVLPAHSVETNRGDMFSQATKERLGTEGETTTATTGNVSPTPSVDAMAFAEPDWVESEDNELAQAELEDTWESLASLREDLGKQVSLKDIGGAEWEKISALIERSKSTVKTEVAIQLAERARAKLMDSRSDFQWRQFQYDLAHSSKNEQSGVVLQFWRAYPQHVQIDEAREIIRSTDTRTWLQLAEDGIATSTARDEGVAEAWLAIAGAWQQAGEFDLSKLASFKARSVISKMTVVERAVESGIELVATGDPVVADIEAWIESITELVASVGSPLLQRSYLAELAGCAQRHGYEALSQRLTNSACSNTNLAGSYARDYLPQYRRCHVLSISGEFDSIHRIVGRLKKYNGSRGYDPLYANAGCFAFAALAAAKQNNAVEYSKAMLLAESQLAGLNHMSAPTYRYLERLAEADLAMGRIDAANVIANQMPDPPIRASLLFRIVLHDAERNCAHDLPDVFQRHGTDRWGPRALAGYVESQVRAEADPLKLLLWIESLESDSLRAAGFAGFATASDERLSPSSSPPDSPPGQPLAAGRSIAAVALDCEFEQTKLGGQSGTMLKAEREIRFIQDPLVAAYACTHTASVYYRQDRVASYERMIASSRQQAFQLWLEIWQDRPQPFASFDGSYQLKDSKQETRRAKQRTLADLAEYYLHLAKLQLELGDGPGALESMLMLVRTAGYQTEVTGATRVAYLVSQALLSEDALEKCHLPVFGIGPRLLDVPTWESSLYARVLVAAWSKELSQLQRHVAELEASRRKDRGQVVRAYSELAILHARRGDLPAYIAARRKAASLMEKRSNLSSLRLVLAEADAWAGEYQLAEDGLTNGKLDWYGTAARPRGILAQQLAANGKIERAELHARQLGESGSFESMQAWSAIAESKMVRLDAPSSEKSIAEVLKWVDSLPQPELRIAALCGLALGKQRLADD